MALRRADPATALDFYRKYLAGSESLAATNPSSAEARRDLLVAQSLVADSHVAVRDYPAADRFYRQALQLAQSLSRDDPRSSQKRADIYELLTKLADLEVRRERFPEAAEWLDQVRAAIRESGDAGLMTSGQCAELDAANAFQQAVCRHARRALDEPPSWIATQPLDLARGLWAVRSLTFARRGDVRAAIESAEALRKLAPDNDDYLVIVARAYALCIDAAARAPAKANANAPAAAAADRPQPNSSIGPALDALRRALQRRPALLDSLTIESDINALCAFPEYRSLLTHHAHR